MSILRIVAGPADVGVGGYTFSTSGPVNLQRVAGAFRFSDAGQSLVVNHGAPVGESTWYHFRYGHSIVGTISSPDIFQVRDAAGLLIAGLRVANSGFVNAVVYGGSTTTSSTTPLANNTSYSIDVQVVRNANTTVRFYINGGLFGEITTTAAGRGTPSSFVFNGQALSNAGAGAFLQFSEIIVADEDTRGMRLREMRPTAFGLFQEWDGQASAVTDTDLATGVSTATANRRVSFGVSNLENIGVSDVINRVVVQSFAQRGETGLTRFNHFFRYRGGAVEDGAPQTLDVLGQRFLEEFPVNPNTAVAWVPEDFRSLQIGVQSLA